MTKETIDYNAKRFHEQLSRFIDFDNDKAIIANNADWLLNMNYVDFLREIGVHFSVNKMLAAECYKQRMERGLTFFEFNYMLMQSYDFYKLNELYDCKMELGGNDQWSNIIGGVELIRRKTGKQAYGLTFKLLTTSEGIKMGKTMKGAVWLDPEKTSPYEFYQYWRNVADADVLKCIKMLTFLPMEQIREMDSWEGAQLNEAKDILAYELTKLVHGEEEAVKAREASKALFAGGGSNANMPTVTLTDEDFTDGSIDLISLMVKGGQATNRSDGRRNIEQGGVSVNDEKMSDVKKTFAKDAFASEFIIKKGKKSFVKYVL
jgi:tyrosyl-tRNA synthetase